MNFRDFWTVVNKIWTKPTISVLGVANNKWYFYSVYELKIERQIYCCCSTYDPYIF